MIDYNSTDKPLENGEDLETLKPGIYRRYANMKLEKVYLVEFIEYTNFSLDTVSDNSADWTKSEYLNCGTQFLVRESDLYKYQKFGKGYRSIKYVGDIEVTD